ncbi:MAG TPA: TonB C-terminal domain-containing protein [Longimicrobiales bacterium]
MDAASILRAHPRPGARPGPAAVLTAIGLHALVALAAWYGMRQPAAPPRAEFRVYRVNIVSPPAQAYGPPTLGPPVVNPDKNAAPEAKPAPPPPAPAARVAPKRAAKPDKAAEKKAAEAARAAAAKAAAGAGKGKGAQAPARGWKPHPDAAVGGSGINVQLQGEEFPYPGYLENIILQISRFFRWNGSPDLRAEAYFVINRDGSVSDIQVTKTSGSFQFDLTVRGAIEAAGQRKAFGKLPQGFEGDRLPISFYFQPPR